MTINKILVVILSILLVLVLIATLFSRIAEEKTKSKNVSVTLQAVDAITWKVIASDINWVFVNKVTSKVFVNKSTSANAKIILPEYINKDKNNWFVSAEAEGYSGVAHFKHSDFQSANFKVFLNKIQKNINIVIQKKAKITINIPIKWQIPEYIDAKINMQKVDEAPLFYAPPHIFSLNYKNNTTTLRMPSDPGIYVVRLYDIKHTEKALKEVRIEAIKANIEINAPDEVIAGTKINLTWKAPEGSEGQINLKEKTKKAQYFSQLYVRTRGRKSANMTMPSKEGEYVFRWYDFYSKKIIIEKNIKIKKAKIKLISKKKVKVGEKLLVKWKAPKNSMAKVYLINDIDKGKNNYFSTNGKKEMEIVVPKKYGKYYFSWVSDGDRREMARHEIEIVEND
jgi:hypothetical protein